LTADERKDDERKDESFSDFIGREGARIAKQVREQAIAASSSEAAVEVPERGQEVAKAIELRDESEIMEEAQGHVIDQAFYSFDHKGHQVTGLAYSGVKIVARVMASGGEPLSVEDLKVDDAGDHVTALTKVVNLKTGEVRWGVASQAKLMKTRRGDVEDEFALVKAVNKAQRNGLRQHIPESAVVAMYREWKTAKERTG